MTEKEFSTLSGQQLHERALQLRESGDLIGSYAAASTSILVHLLRNELSQAAEASACAVITLRVTAGLQEHPQVKKKILEQAEAVMIRGVQLAQQSKDPTALALPMYQLAEVREDLGQYENAVDTYKQAIGHMRQDPPVTHNWPSVIADMEIHLYSCAYKTGDKNALDKVIQALRELENNPDPDDFNQHVWMSGGHMRLAEILRKDDPEKAQYHLLEAKKIIDGDLRLKNRKDQWDQLAATCT